MPPKLTEEQRQALQEAAGVTPVHVIDPVTNTAYVLVRADVYERMRAAVEDFDPRETYPFVDEVLREDDAQDPALDSYQDLSSGPRTS